MQRIYRTELNRRCMWISSGTLESYIGTVCICSTPLEALESWRAEFKAWVSLEDRAHACKLQSIDILRHFSSCWQCLGAPVSIVNDNAPLHCVLPQNSGHQSSSTPPSRIKMDHKMQT